MTIDEKFKENQKRFQENMESFQGKMYWDKATFSWSYDSAVLSNKPKDFTPEGFPKKGAYKTN